jgi:bis(5'-nucleosyl)-tetraphosphatase (symmetrical)
MSKKARSCFFFVGDVQGCHQELLDLLAAAGFDRARHQLAFVGDLVNRGPQSRAVLELARDHDALVVLGNHEEALLLGHSSETLDRVRAQLDDEWLRWIASWPPFVRGGGDDPFILVHGGIPPGVPPEDADLEQLLKLRTVDDRPWFDFWSGPETVVFGHWATRGKVDLPLVKGLDTGCVYGRELTGLFWPERRWVSVPARRMWFDPVRRRPTW